jgi:hypothetical protein
MWPLASYSPPSPANMRRSPRNLALDTRGDSPHHHGNPPRRAQVWGPELKIATHTSRVPVMSVIMHRARKISTRQYGTFQRQPTRHERREKASSARNVEEPLRAP